MASIRGLRSLETPAIPQQFRVKADNSIFHLLKKDNNNLFEIKGVLYSFFLFCFQLRHLDKVRSKIFTNELDCTLI